MRSRRVRQVLSEGTRDPDVLAHAHKNGYALLTHDEQITHHIATRHQEGKDHAGVFIADHHLQGQRGIGTVVTFILEYHELISEAAVTFLIAFGVSKVTPPADSMNS